MNFSNEMIEKAKTASSVEELLEMAKAEGVELSAADAETYFSFLKNNGPLSDEELEQVAGGKGEKIPDPKYHAGQKVNLRFSTNVFYNAFILSSEYSKMQKGWYYKVRLVDTGDEYDNRVFDWPLEMSVFRTRVIG